MKNIKIKIINFLLVLIGIFLLVNDIFTNNNFIKNKIIAENYISFPKLGIKKFFDKILSTKYLISSYFNDINNINYLLEENSRLKDELEKLTKLNDVIELNLNPHANIYKNFNFIPIDIINNNENYGIVHLNAGKAKQGDLIINDCQIVGKILNVGNNFAILSLSNNKKFLIPFVIKGTQNNGLYSVKENKILEIKNKNNLKIGDELITFEKTNKIPNGIPITKIIQIYNDQIILDSKKCEKSDFGIIITKKES